MVTALVRGGRNFTQTRASTRFFVKFLKKRKKPNSANASGVSWRFFLRAASARVSPLVTAKRTEHNTGLRLLVP